MDLFAAEIDMDPAELRRHNYHTPEAFPLTTPTGASYDSGDYRASLEAALEAAGYDGLRAEQAARRERGDHRLMGIGVSTYVEVTSPIGPVCTETGRLELRPDGTVLARTGATPFGQGHVTTLSMVAVDDAGTLLNPLGPRASASREPWAPPPQCRTRWWTPCRTSASATSTCPPPPKRSGRHSFFRQLALRLR